MTLLPRLLALLAFALPAMPAFAVSEAELLPVDQAFALTAVAPSRDRIEVQWKVADGYYLYRHRIDVQVDGAGFQAGKLQLPKGKAYRDEFFGDVETYHEDLTGVLAGEAAAGADSVALKVKYQGCADAGICYPPQTRRLVVKLPAAGGTSGLPSPLGATNAAGLPRFGQAASSASGAIEALPLPQEQAFAFEAIAYDGNQLLLRFTPAPGYYVYRDRTSMKLEGAKHIALDRPRWPKGQSHRDEHFGEVVVYFDQAEVPVPLRRSSGEAADATLKVTFQGCQKDGICYPPMTRAVKLKIPKGEVTSTADAGETADAPLIPALPGASPNATSPASDSGAGLAPAAVSADAPQEVARTTPPADVLRKAGKTTSVWLALLLALAGGLVLNLMPCVLPVLSLKALSLADSGRGGGHARASALWYTAGVLLSFLAIGAIALALRAAGQALGWGFQLQQPLVIGALVYLMFAVGLSLSGVFALGHRFAGAGHELTARSGPAGDFFTGVLAVVIASPCTAPFMGAALAFAFAASKPVALLVFAFLGLGLALPFLLIAFVPGLAQRLPKPGAWMETLKHFLAFPMYLTAVWLLWVLGKQRGVDAIGLALVGLVLLALGLWWYQRLRLQVAPLRRTLAVLLLLASVVPLVLVHRLQRETASPTAIAGEQAVPYSAAKLAALRAEGRVVFVDMTADWCVTCKANEKAVFARENFRASMRQADAVFMQGDWTNVDPAITEFLEAHQAVGVPLYVVFPSDGGEGEVLPTVLTQNRVAEALARAKR